ncbi:MAG: radical SAM protein [Oscillospiraceae bacterium]
MKHNNIAIFIPHLGCKNSCSFCNQRTISGTQKSPTIKEVRDVLNKAALQIENKNDTEIAFFGGSFTAIDNEYMLALLETANEFVGDAGFSGIRISTRPDAINCDVLQTLKKYHVNAIELGAQSMSQEVLDANDRGHTTKDVLKSSELIKQFGFELGLQMMVGLFSATPEKDIATAEKIIELAPDTVRIYPTVILKHTKLCELFLDGRYKPISLETAVSLCAKLLVMFEQNSIKVIKLGLHASNEVQNEMVGGIYHPAFRELCEGKIYLDNAIAELKKSKFKSATLVVDKSAVSKMIGQKRCNINALADMGYKVHVCQGNDIPLYKVFVNEEV